MFEVVEPILEGDEVFDSSLLKQMVDSMIAAGKRNICVDLAGQDYLYSDAINALVGINKRMLDVMGRLSLVAPQPPVVEILKKGGIANILKIFENDDELMRVSQQLMGGAPPVASVPEPPRVQQEPQSEFDELRSEIGSAFGSISPAASPQTPQRRESAPPPSPFADAGFRQGPKPIFPSAPPVPAQPQFAPPPVAGPRYAPPPPPFRTFEPAVQKPSAPRPVVPPPPPVTKLPAAPIVSGGETRRIPAVSFSEIPTPPPVRAQPEPQPEPDPVFAPQPEEDLNKFEATLEKKPIVPDVPKRDRFEEDLQTAKKKPSFVPVLIALVVLIGLGAGGYFAYTTYSKKSTSGTAITTPAQETAIPQVPVPAPEPSLEKPADTQPATPAVVNAPVSPAVSPAAEKATAAAKEAAAVKAAEAKEAAALKVAAAREAAAEKAAAAKEAAALKAAAAKEAAAKIAANREAAIKEAGARAAAAREAAAAKAAATKATEPPPVNRPSTIEVFDEPAPTPAPKSAIAPPPAPEPEPAPTAAPNAAASPSGEAATVFLASIPPLADVYMDGKLIGKSNSILTVATGTHTLRFAKGEKEITKQFTFTPGKNSPSFVKLP